MARMLDRIVARGIHGYPRRGNPVAETVAYAAGKCERFEIDNVAQYLHMNPQEEWDIARDFPNLAPPFSSFWMEYQQPKVVYSDELGLRYQGPGERVEGIGALVFGMRTTHKISARDFVQGALSLVPAVSKQARAVDLLSLVDANPEWFVGFVVFVEMRRDYFLWLGNRYLWLNKSGCLIEDYGSVDGKPKAVSSIWTTLPNPTEEFLALPRLAQDEISTGLLTAALFPLNLAVSLLHCKNVEMAAAGEVPPKLQRAYQKRHKHPLLTYRVLEIEPMKKVLRREGESETMGLKHALHICRGHFKDYRERGLFGSRHGIYWWDQHLRGDGNQGVIVKDYAVNAPSGKARP